MSKEKKISKCSNCGGKLRKVGTIGRISYSRCESCGKEQTKTLKKASLDKAVSANTLKECITCSAKYAAAGDPDLCPECHASFTGVTAAGATKTKPGKSGIGGDPKKKEVVEPEVIPSREEPLTVPDWKDLPPAPAEPEKTPEKEPEKVPVGVETEQLPVRNMEIDTPAEPARREIVQPDVVPSKEQPLTVPEWEDLPPAPAEPTKEPEKVPVGVEFDVFPIALNDEQIVREFVSPSKFPKRVKEDEGMLVAASTDKTAGDNAYPNSELTSLIQQQREDTSRWQNGENHSPNPNVDPSLLRADSDVPDVERNSETSVESGPDVETTVIAKVFANSKDDIDGAKVLLSDGEFQVIGKVTLEAEDGFAVEWRTGRKSIEKKANYELVVAANGSEHINEEEYDQRPGGPFDRGAADSHYRRGFQPHYYVGETHHSERVEITDKDSDEYKAYSAGFRVNEQNGDYKNWGE